MVPLIGFVSDQVNKTINLGQRVEAHHVDENPGDDFLSLTDRLLSIQKHDGRLGSSIIIYCLPQSLDPTTKLSSCLKLVA